MAPPPHDWSPEVKSESERWQRRKLRHFRDSGLERAMEECREVKAHLKRTGRIPYEKEGTTLDTTENSDVSQVVPSEVATEPALANPQQESNQEDPKAHEPETTHSLFFL